MRGMALMHTTADAAVWHQGPQEDITLTPVDRSLIVHMVVITMICGDRQGDGNRSHRGLPQSRPHTMIVHIWDDSGRHRHRRERCDSDSTCLKRAWGSGDLEFMRRHVPDRTGMMRKHEWSQRSMVL